MVVTVLLSGVSYGVNMTDLARELDKNLQSDEVGSFVARDLHCRSKQGKRLVALDFKTGFDAMIAQDILNGLELINPDTDQKYVLTAKVTNNPDYLPDPRENHLTTPPPPVYSETLVAYTSHREQVERSHEELDDEIATLQRKLIIVHKKTKLMKAKKKLKKFKKKLKRADSESSESEPRKKKKSKKRKSRSSSPQPSTSRGKVSKKYTRSSSSSSSDRGKRRKRARSSSSSSSSPEPSRAFPVALPSTEHRSDRSTNIPQRTNPSKSPNVVIPLPKSRWDTPTTDSQSDSTAGSATALERDRMSRQKSRERERKSPLRNRQSQKRSTSRSSPKSVERHHSSKPLEKRLNSPNPPDRHRTSPKIDDKRLPSPNPAVRRQHSSHDSRRSPIRFPLRSPPRKSHSRRSRSRSRGLYDRSEIRSILRRCDEERSHGHRPSFRARSPSPRRRSPFYRRQPLRSRHSKSRSPHSRSDPSQQSETSAGLLTHYDLFTDLYRKMQSNKSAQPGNRGIMIVERNSALQPTTATVTEIHDDLDLLLENVPEMEEQDVTDSRNSSPTEGPTNINVTINVVKKKTPQDLDAELERDRMQLQKIKEEIQKAESPKKRFRSEVSSITGEELRNYMPKPIETKVKTENDTSSDDDVVVVDVVKPKKTISSNPKFVIPIMNICKQMRCHTSALDADKKKKTLGILRRILRARIKDLLEGREYMNSRSILELYRQHYDTEQDGEFVASVYNSILDGAFPNFVPSDDEDYESGRDDQDEYLPFVSGKKKKKNNTDKKENVLKNNEREVALSEDNKIKEEVDKDKIDGGKVSVDIKTEEDLVILEKDVDVIDITNSDEDECKITKTPCEVVPGSNNVNVASEEMENASKPPKTLNIKYEEGESLSHAGEIPLTGKVKIENVLSAETDNLDDLRVKVEIESSEGVEEPIVIDLDDDSFTVNTENDDVNVKSEASTVDLSENFPGIVDELNTLIKSEPDTDDCNYTDSTKVKKDSKGCLQSDVVTDPEPNKKDHYTISVVTTKVVEPKKTVGSMKTIFNLASTSINESNLDFDYAKQGKKVPNKEPNVLKTKEVAPISGVKMEPEETVESIENFVKGSTIIIDDTNLDSDNDLDQDAKANNDKLNVQSSKKDAPNNAVKTEPEETVESIEKFLKCSSVIIDETNLDTDDDTSQDATAKINKPNLQSSKEDAPNNAVKTEPDETLESIEKFVKGGPIVIDDTNVDSSDETNDKLNIQDPKQNSPKQAVKPYTTTEKKELRRKNRRKKKPKLD